MPEITNFDHHHGHEPPMATASPPPPKPKPDAGQLLYLLIKSALMSLILFLFFFLIGMAAMFLIHFLVLSDTFRHRRRSPTAAYSKKDLQKHLPRLKFANFRRPNSPKECAVCLDSFKDGDWCRNLPSCGHIFHQRCVDKWLTKVSNCPICRTEVKLDLMVSDSSYSDEDYKLFW